MFGFFNLFNFNKQYTVLLKTNKTDLSGFVKKNNYSLQLIANHNESLYNVIQKFNNYRKNIITQFLINNINYNLSDLKNFKVNSNLIIYV